jgi:hypothetical protein
MSYGHSVLSSGIVTFLPGSRSHSRLRRIIRDVFVLVVVVVVVITVPSPLSSLLSFPFSLRSAIGLSHFGRSVVGCTLSICNALSSQLDELHSESRP